MADAADRKARKVSRIVEKIRPLLRGHPPEVQGAVIADLLSLFIAGHHPALRDEVMLETVDCARKLIEPNENIIFDLRGGKPEGWEKQ